MHDSHLSSVYQAELLLLLLLLLLQLRLQELHEESHRTCGRASILQKSIHMN